MKIHGKNIYRSNSLLGNILILIAFLFIISIAINGVNAGNIYVNGTGGNDNIGDGTIDNPYASIKKGVDRVNNADKDIIIKSGIYKGTNNVTIHINKNINFYGEKYYVRNNGEDASRIGATIIDGEELNWLFKITNGANVNFYGITFQNAQNTEGGVINVNDSNLFINSCDFVNNNANKGGAIYSTDSNLNIDNSNFINNYLKNHTASDFYAGGAIFISNSDTKISNSNFTNNSGTILIEEDGEIAASSGGTIFGELSDLKIINSIIKDSLVSGHGGAIQFVEGSLTINKTQFINNKVKEELNGNGGTLYLYSSDVKITNSVFVNSSATSGGFIYSINSNLNINKSNLTGGYALKEPPFAQGGGINYIITNNSNNALTLSNCKIEECFSNFYGSAISIVVYPEDGEEMFFAKLNIINSSFINNQGYHGTAVIQIENTIINIENSKFENNNVEILGPTTGGAIHLTTIKYSNFTNNEGSSIIFLMNNSELNIINCNFINNSADLGIIVNLEGNCNIDNSLFTNNYNSDIDNTNISKGIIINGGTMNIKSSKFYNNKGLYGGAIVNGLYIQEIIEDNIVIVTIYGGKKLNIQSSEFVNNTATYGGAIFNPGNYSLLNDNVLLNISGGRLTVSNSIFRNNKADYGGAIAAMEYRIYDEKAKYTSNDWIDINSSYFINNTAKNHGSSIYNIGKMNIINCEFVSTNGEVIYNNGSNVVIKNNKFSGGDYAIVNKGIKATIINNNINNVKYGIKNQGKQTTISNNKIADSKYGIFNTAEKVSITKNSINRVQYGINNGGDQTKIVKNGINGIRYTKGYGIKNQGKQTTISSNRVSNNKFGIWNKATNVKINENRIDKVSTGIYNNANSNKLLSNKITNFKHYGIYSKGHKNTIALNTIVNKGKKGYAIYTYKQSKNNLIVKNKVAKSKCGICIVNGHKTNKIKSNAIYYNKIGLASSYIFYNKSNKFKGNDINFKKI